MAHGRIFRQACHCESILGGSDVVSRSVTGYANRYNSLDRFTPGIMTMQFVTVFFPLLEVYQLRHHRRSIEASNSSDAHGVPTLVSGTPNRMAPTITPSTAGSTRNPGRYTLRSLNDALENNIEPLLQFAARRDFSAENVLFLQAVASFKSHWAKKESPENLILAKQRSVLFVEALQIYEIYVSLRLSKAPLNLSHTIRVALEQVFEAASAQRRLPQAREDVFNPFFFGEPPSATPLADFNQPSAGNAPRSDDQEDTVDAINPAPSNGSLTSLSLDVEVPDSFKKEVFDKAEDSVKNLVLTNTWSRSV